METNNQLEPSTNGDIVLSSGIRLTYRNAIFPDSLTQQQWFSFGAFIGGIRQAEHFWRADWLAHGRTSYGPKVVAHAVEQLELDLNQLKHADLLNRLGERRIELSKEHHFVLAKAKLDATAVHTWLELSIKEDLTARELEESLRAGQVVKLYIEDYQRSGGFASIEGLASMWRMLRRQIGDLWQEWSPEEIKNFLSYIEPIESFAKDLRERIKGGVHAG